MPNWCYNTGTISGSKEQIDKLEVFLEERKGENWFDFFAPTPKELENEGWYEWNVSNWGTKWNTTTDWHREDDETIRMTFDTAWSPPTQLYDTIQDQGYDVHMEYCEEGMCFVGEYIHGEDDFYEYTNGLEDLDDIPEHLVENWNLRENLEGWEDEEDWNEEEEIEEIAEEFDTLSDESKKKVLEDLQKEFDELKKES